MAMRARFLMATLAMMLGAATLLPAQDAAPPAAPPATATPRPLPPGMSISATVQPESPIAGDYVIYSVTLHGSVEAEDVKFPNWGQVKGLILVAGAAQPTRRFAIDNGRTSQSFEFKLLTSEPGVVEIPPSRFLVNGYWYDTNPITLTVREVPKDASSIDGLISARSSDPNVNTELRNTYFAKTEIPERVYQGQAVPVTIYIYKDVKMGSFVQYDPGQPSGPDFLFPNPQASQNASQSVNWEKVSLGGRQFDRIPLLTFYAVPTKTGTLKLAPPLVKIYFQGRRGGHSADIDALLGMGMAGFNRIEAELPMRTQDVKVDAVPEKPAEAAFQVVGNITAKAEVDRTQLSRRELLSVKLTLTGESYLEMLTPPDLGNLPKLSLIDKKTNTGMIMDRLKLISQKQFEYVFQAMDEGDVTIPSLAIALVDPATGEQKIVRTEAFPIKITPANADAVQVGGTTTTPGQPATPDKAEARVLGQDVAYIDASPLTEASTVKRQPYYLHPVFWALHLLPLGAAVLWGASAIRARRAGIEDEGTRRSRGRKAAQNAVREARKQLPTAKRDEFYATLGNGMMDYVASLLGRSAKGLTVEEAASELQRTGRDAAACEHLLNVLRNADAIRYSPAPDTPESREKALAEAESALASLDQKEHAA